MTSLSMMTTSNNKSYNAPKLWGIINITPDSFSDGGLFLNPEKAYEHLCSLLKDGADFLDIGAASSRPNAPFISEEEEWQRLEPFFQYIEENDTENAHQIFSRFSVDTWRASIAQKVLEKGIYCINDISAFEWDSSLLDVVADYQPYYILMHCQGIPETMQMQTDYTNVIDTVYSFFEQKLDKLYQKNFPKEKIILDPGIGFGKTLEQNLALLNAGEHFSQLGLPLMAAVSRKSWLCQLLSLDKSSTAELDNATAQASTLLHTRNYIHHRVHNVKKVQEAFSLFNSLTRKGI